MSTARVGNVIVDRVSAEAMQKRFIEMVLSADSVIRRLFLNI